MITDEEKYLMGRLTAGPVTDQPKDAYSAGVQYLGFDSRKDGNIYVPVGYCPTRPAALAVMLHGAGGTAEHGISYLGKYADDHTIILLAPASRSSSWDIISYNSFGPDVVFIDRALNLVFERYVIDTSHIAIGGFSDGASYALSLGLSNGDLFTHVIAFSPGFVYTKEMTGKPSVFISHGTKDPILPINPCSRRVKSQLERLDYNLNYTEFEGEHDIPANISGGAVEWFIKSP
ncbi:alpha/beta hydrolase [Telluribacter sp.]|jgi:predicted esterase|uniref:alpha/beta hydrolase n=1 Tax=Telluribacter sp. TaxID=1978767 RepID=UPI002E0E10FE|nr:phospholipase [Telluribacter sp.]